jgi:hypothetical protein
MEETTPAGIVAVRNKRQFRLQLKSFEGADSKIGTAPQILNPRTASPSEPSCSGNRLERV